MIFSLPVRARRRSPLRCNRCPEADGRETTQLSHSAAYGGIPQAHATYSVDVADEIERSIDGLELGIDCPDQNRRGRGWLPPGKKLKRATQQPGAPGREKAGHGGRIRAARFACRRALLTIPKRVA